VALIREIDREIEDQKYAERTENERIELLTVEDNKVEAARRQKEHAALIERMQGMFAQRTEVAAEMARSLPKRSSTSASYLRTT
jgi:uncharacterized protein YeeX (DUF496 family)